MNDDSRPLTKDQQAVLREERFDWSLVGWPQWVRVPWLRGLYFPFWNAYHACRRAWIAARNQANLVTDDELYALTQELECHPEGWDHPCMCSECRSYFDE